MSFSSLLKSPAGDFDSFLSAQGFDTLLKQLLEKLQQERPSDPISFAIAFLDTHRNQENTGNDDDADMDTGDEIVDEVPVIYRNKARRGAFSSESNGEVESITMTPESKPKDEETSKRLNEALSSHILCSHLDESERKEVFDHMSEEIYPAGTIVIKQGKQYLVLKKKELFELKSTGISIGSDGNSFYVVDEGELEVFVTSNDGSRKKVQHLKSGGSFGELALIYNNPRAADVIVTTFILNFIFIFNMLMLF